MTRVLALLCAAGTASAQDPPPTDVRTFSATAAPASVPALKHELLPKLRDRTVGNAAMDYHRAFLLRPAWPRDPAESRRQDEQVTSWEGMSAADLPAAEVKRFLFAYAPSFQSLDRAALCDRCDWDQGRRPGLEEIGSLLPEVQSVRELARMQKLRVRADLADNDFDAAIRGLQSAYRMSKDVGEGTTLIQLLVGVAIGSIFIGETEQFIQRPGSPNLYWALTTLPAPFIDPRRALEGESRVFAGLFPNLAELEKGPLPAERANQILAGMSASLVKLAGADRSGPEAALAKLGVGAHVLMSQGDAKKQLVEMGLKAEDLDKMPGAQVVALRATLTFRSMSDDQAKAFSLPYTLAHKELAKVKERAAKLKKTNTDPLVTVFVLSLPATEKVYEATARMGRRLAGLRAIEAIRLHAAMNNGAPPKSLADITLVPVPDDPYTGKPFGYTADGAKFTLSAPHPVGDQPNQGNNFRYEVTIRGK